MFSSPLFPPSSSLCYPRACFHVFCSTCLPGSSFSRPPEPNTCVSSELQEKVAGCRRKQPVTTPLPLRSYLTQPACSPPVWRARVIPDIVFLWEGQRSLHILYLGSWEPSRHFSTVLSHMFKHSWTHTAVHTHTERIVLLANLFSTMGCFSIVSRDNPLTATRWPALSHQWNDLAANHKLCNIHEWKQGWMVE